ncbi:MAG: hypothetical protein AAF322_10100 [Pseudomonadota bacterium]
MRSLLFATIALAAAFALRVDADPAGAPMNGDAFRDYAEGWTLFFETEDGDYFGAEQYFPNNQTLWMPRGGACTPGVWAEDQDRICFLYEVGISCWRLFHDGDDGMRAVNDDGGGAPPTRIRVSRKEREPLLCPDGPGV